MWNNHRILNVMTVLLLATVTLAVLYALALRYPVLSPFSLNKISVKGVHGNNVDNQPVHHISREQIEAVVRKDITGNFLTVDLTAVRHSFEKLPWVRTATVNRDWWDGLEVLLEEHVVLARWHDSALVNTYGEIFQATLNEKLPVFIGPTEENSGELMQRYHNFNEILKPLQQSITEIHLSPRHAWRVRLETGMELKLGRTEMEIRLARYRSVYSHGIAELNQQMTINYLDLRYPNGFAASMSKITQSTSNKFRVRKSI